MYRSNFITPLEVKYLTGMLCKLNTIQFIGSLDSIPGNELQTFQYEFELAHLLLLVFITDIDEGLFKQLEIFVTHYVIFIV